MIISFFSISHRFMFACNFFTFVSYLNYCSLPYCHILPTPVLSNPYFCISFCYTCLFITFNAVGVNFVLIALLFLFIAPDEVRSSS